MANYLDGMDGGKHNSDNTETNLPEILKRQEAIDRLVDDDLDSFQDGQKDGDNSYAAALLEFGHKGYADYSNEELASELKERFDFNSFKVIDDEQE
jgi:hypothetical protein